MAVQIALLVQKNGVHHKLAGAVLSPLNPFGCLKTEHLPLLQSGGIFQPRNKLLPRTRRMTIIKIINFQLFEYNYRQYVMICKNKKKPIMIPFKKKNMAKDVFVFRICLLLQT